jgi:xylulokinase
MQKLLGIDVGTSGCKVLLINEAGSILREASAEYSISCPHPNWSEQDPNIWIEGISKCLEEIGERKPDAIGLTGQMHGGVFLDSDSQVIRPAILWNDQRTFEESTEIEKVVGSDRIREITCNPPLTGFQLPKLIWLRKNEPDAYRRISKILLPKDYVRFWLSGFFATDVSDASGTAMFDVPNRRWSPEILSKMKIPDDWLPECFESDMITTQTHGRGWFEAGIPIAAGGGDQAAAAVGTGAVVPGVTSVSLGTSGVVFTSIPEPTYHASGTTHTFCHANRGWHAMGVMLSCGGALRWFRDTLGAGKGYDELAELASRVPPGANGLTFAPYLSGERCPFVDPFATASFSGIRLDHGISEFARAVFEGASVGLDSAMDLLTSLGATKSEVRVTGGGAKSDFWVQMLCDMFKRSCRTMETDEGPAFGAAILAGVSIGVWESPYAASTVALTTKKEFKPQSVDYDKVKARSKDAYPHPK